MLSLTSVWIEVLTIVYVAISPGQLSERYWWYIIRGVKNLTNEAIGSPSDKNDSGIKCNWF